MLGLLQSFDCPLVAICLLFRSLLLGLEGPLGTVPSILLKCKVTFLVLDLMLKSFDLVLKSLDLDPVLPAKILVVLGPVRGLFNGIVKFANPALCPSQFILQAS